MRTEGRINIHVEANSLFSQFCAGAKKERQLILISELLQNVSAQICSLNDFIENKHKMASMVYTHTHTHTHTHLCSFCVCLHECV